MTSFVHTQYPTQHPGVDRIERTVETLRQVASDVQSPNSAVSALIAPIQLIARAIARRFNQWSKARHQAYQDQLMWERALSDPRLMAELRRAIEE